MPPGGLSGLIAPIAICRWPPGVRRIIAARTPSGATWKSEIWFSPSWPGIRFWPRGVSSQT
jgi:hypothetical protein